MAWQQDRVKDIVKKLRKNPVYAAVGDELKQAMIYAPQLSATGSTSHPLGSVSPLSAVSCRPVPVTM